MSDIIENLKEKIKAFSEEEQKILFSLKPIHFAENPSDVEIIDYLENLCNMFDEGEPNADEIINIGLNVLFKNKNISKDIQEFILENFMTHDMENLSFDKDVIVKVVDNYSAIYDDLPEHVKTDDLFISCFASKQQKLHIGKIRFVSKRINQEFVKNNYDNPEIVNKEFGQIMLGKARSKRIKTFLALKFGLPDEKK